MMRIVGDEGERMSGSPVVQGAANVQRRYPNGTLATGAGALGTVIVWLATNLGHLPMDASAGAAFATVFAGVASFVGRKGLKGCFHAIWAGAGDED